MKYILIAVIVAQVALLVHVDNRIIAARVERDAVTMELRQELQRIEKLTHPATIQHRTIGMILLQGEFEVKP